MFNELIKWIVEQELSDKIITASNSTPKSQHRFNYDIQQRVLIMGHNTYTERDIIRIKKHTDLCYHVYTSDCMVWYLRATEQDQYKTLVNSIIPKWYAEQEQLKGNWIKEQ